MFDYDRLEELRKSKGITQKFIADTIRRKPSIFQAWRDEKSIPSEQQLRAVANILGTTPEYLNGETDEKTPATISDGDKKADYDELTGFVLDIMKQLPTEGRIQLANKAQTLKEEYQSQDTPQGSV